MMQQPKSRIVTFFSAAGNTGTTNTVFSVAQSLVKHSDMRIGVLCLNGWDDSADYIETPSAYLDTLKSRLAGRKLNDDAELLERFTEIQSERLYILAGNRNRRMERLYTPEEVEYLIERAESIFDVVLIDAGSHLDNALSAQAIYATNHHYALLSQQPKVLKRFKQLYDDILHPLSIEKRNLNIVLNMYQEKSYLLNDKQIAKELEVDVINTIPRTDDGIISELESRILYSYPNPKYQASIDWVVKQIGKDLNIVLKDVDVVKKSFFTFRNKAKA